MTAEEIGTRRTRLRNALKSTKYFDYITELRNTSEEITHLMYMQKVGHCGSKAYSVRYHRLNMLKLIKRSLQSTAERIFKQFLLDFQISAEEAKEMMRWK
jgi:hypothetical protein